MPIGGASSQNQRERQTGDEPDVEMSVLDACMNHPEQMRKSPMAHAVSTSTAKRSPQLCNRSQKEPGAVDPVARFAKIRRLTMPRRARIRPSVLCRHPAPIYRLPEERKHHTPAYLPEEPRVSSARMNHHYGPHSSVVNAGGCPAKGGNDGRDATSMARKDSAGKSVFAVSPIAKCLPRSQQDVRLAEMIALGGRGR